MYEKIESIRLRKATKSSYILFARDTSNLKLYENIENQRM